MEMHADAPDLATRARRFREAYGQHRAAEGRAASTEELLALPYLARGPLARQWRVRARTFDGFVARVLQPRAAQVARPLTVADLGAGNGWLCYRAKLLGHRGIAIDIRTDNVDGLGAAIAYDDSMRNGAVEGETHCALFARVAASFEAIPLASRTCDVAVFNAALHYALDLRTAIAEALRIVVSGGRIVILDSPVYAEERAGAAMVAAKRRNQSSEFGARAEDLMSLDFVEFLTAARLETASTPLGIVWQRHRVRYPLWYEARPIVARLRGQRTPSRFDLWEAVVP